MLLYNIKVIKYNLPLEFCSIGNIVVFVVFIVVFVVFIVVFVVFIVVFEPKKNNSIVYYYETILSVNTPSTYTSVSTVHLPIY